MVDSIEDVGTMVQHREKNSKSCSQYWTIIGGEDVFYFWKKMFCDASLPVVCMVNDKLTCICFGVKNIPKNVVMKSRC